MITAFINGLIGIGLSLTIGLKYLDFSVLDTFLCVLASNFAALIALLITLQAERVPWIRKHWLNRSLKTWTLLVFLYLGIVLIFSPPLRAVQPLLYLVLPLILSTGFAIIVFGPVQDRLIKRMQRKAIEETESKLKTESKNDFPCFPTDSAML